MRFPLQNAFLFGNTVIAVDSGTSADKARMIEKEKHKRKEKKKQSHRMFKKLK
jgi:hypothetical protein